MSPDAVRTDDERIVDEVKARYGRIAEGSESSCCGPAPCCGSIEESVSAGIGYTPADLAAVPEGANLGLGCGAPLAFLDPRPGETVLDLGSGAGFDAFLAARKVGPSGRVIGVDMTPAMIERARGNAVKAGLGNVEFREGRLEALPVESASVDAITSNCVINLVPDKAKVFVEAARVLRAGGRLVVSDIVLDGRLPEALERDVLAYVGCVAGAMQRHAYFGALEAAGFTAVELLKDVDYVSTMLAAVPGDVQTLLERTGTREEDVRGKVRSVTYRAVRA